ncbi:MAG: GNAT family N-acetyltransferase [Rhodanobacter sp.]|uniref:GNAT family N-acetyltransferase n=1 Tax=Rhodanobacter sp. KK11 TaxID=3083255 RepID=UPI002965FFC5|nr:GNAT family N-acetyltransferase [Rhodanobacter sp. KK11]MDW2981283.1 GNAT family N-acetyltransferase [Rhodanobacter sp. KK11]
MSGWKVRFEDLDRANQPVEAFDCGNAVLTRYLRTQAGQDVRRHIAACVVALDGETGAVAGYYTLSASRVDRNGLPDELVKKLPRHEHLPAALLGRLAVDVAYQGKGLGGALLMDAAEAVIASPVAAWAMIVDPIDNAAAVFYGKYGFQKLETDGTRMFIPMKTLAKALSQ